MEASLLGFAGPAALGVAALFLGQLLGPHLSGRPLGPLDGFSRWDAFPAVPAINLPC